MKMMFEVEKQPFVQVSNFKKIEKSLRNLKSYGPQSYAILTNKHGSYLQVAGGRVTCVLEMREQSNDKHYRAYLRKAKVPFTGQQTLMFGGGHMKMEPDEILFINDVVQVFEAFFYSKDLPKNILWRDMSHAIKNI